ncbi:hypothetical protein ACTTAI_18415 [Rhodobacter capsulatus]|uniref:hypothetical protein n=1 Tax=Rhodobacter capsulatus TaxID=1061 RepID=UPI00402A21CF
MANCSKCGEKVSRFDLFEGLCPDCHASKRQLEAAEKAAADEAERAANEAHEARLAAIMLTTESSSDLGVETRLGVIAAEYVVGLNIFIRRFVEFRLTLGSPLIFSCSVDAVAKPQTATIEAERRSRNGM